MVSLKVPPLLPAAKAPSMDPSPKDRIHEAIPSSLRERLRSPLSRSTEPAQPQQDIATTQFLVTPTHVRHRSVTSLIRGRPQSLFKELTQPLHSSTITENRHVQSPSRAISACGQRGSNQRPASTQVVWNRRVW